MIDIKKTNIYANWMRLNIPKEDVTSDDIGLVLESTKEELGNKKVLKTEITIKDFISDINSMRMIYEPEGSMIIVKCLVEEGD